MMKICHSNIPDELKSLRQWVCWDYVPDESRPDKPKKMPINPLTGGRAQSNNPETWTDFTAALTAAEQHEGIGFMFAGGYFGVDIDGAENAIIDYRNGDAGNIVAEFVYTLQSYAEYSVSGKGIHILCRGTLPPHGRRRKNVEMYETGRFFTVTGNIAGPYTELADCTERIKPLHEKYIGGGSEPVANTAPAQLNLSETEILDLAARSKNGATFQDLMAGRWENYFTSQSEADLSLCNMLAFWCGRDEVMMDRIFRSSGLMRDKWNRVGEGTIGKAVRDCQEVYTPKEQYRVTIGKAPVKKQRLYSFDDTGNAERFVDLYGEYIRYSYVNKSFYYYDNRRWLADQTGAVKRMADGVVEAMKSEREAFLEAQPAGADLEEMGKVFDKFLKSCRSNKSKTAMMKETEHHVPILPENFDRHKHLLNTPNGIVNLKTGELAAHDKDRYITKITHGEYTDKTDAPLWTRFLSEIFNGDAELIRYMQKAVGYSLTGSTKEDCAFFCYGTGRNGKSTLLGTISEILGEYAINVQPETIMLKNNSGGGPSSDIARLKGARFVVVPEPAEGARLNEGLVKQMTGGDVMTASRKYENEFEFTPEFKLWMPTNHKPRVYGTDVGIWSRIRLIPFTVRIPDERIDRNLRQKLKQETAGILKWAVDGCLLWQREGLKPPKAVQAATAEYKTEMDALASFLDQCCEIGPWDAVSGDVFRAYINWAKENNEYEMTSTKFGVEMGKRFEKHKVAGMRFYRGLRVQEDLRAFAVHIGGKADK